MADGGKVIIKMQLDDKKAKQGIKDVDKGLDKLAKDGNKNVQGLSKGFGGLGKSILSGLVNPVTLALGAFTALYKITKKAVSSAINLERSETRLETILKTVSNATDEQISSIKNLSQEYEDMLGISADTTNALASQLASFGLNADGIEQLMLPALDAMVAQYNTLDVTQEQSIQTANLLGKALTGQVGALSRVGILMNDNQKELIANGDEATRLATIIEVLGDNYGGLATALGETTEGSIARMKESLESLFELMGAELLPVIADMAGELREAFQSEQAKAFTMGLTQVIKSIFSIIKSVWELGKILGEIFSFGTSGFELLVMVITWVADVLHMLTSALKGDFGEAFLFLKKAFVGLLKFIGTILSQITNILTFQVESILTAFTFILEKLGGVVAVIMNGILLIINFVLGEIEDFVNNVIELLNFLIKQGNKLGLDWDLIGKADMTIKITGQEAVDGMLKGLTVASKFLDELPTTIENAVTDLSDLIFTEEDIKAVDELNGVIQKNTDAVDWGATLTEGNTEAVAENTDTTAEESRKQEDFLLSLFNEIRAGIFDTSGGINQQITSSVLMGDFSLDSVGVSTPINVVVESNINLDGTVVAKSVSVQERNSSGYR